MEGHGRITEVTPRLERCSDSTINSLRELGLVLFLFWTRNPYESVALFKYMKK